MQIDLVQFLGSLAAVAALFAAVHLLGFTQAASLVSEDEARELLRHVPGGFEAEELAIDRRGGGALGRDAAGRIALLVPHGTRFVGRIAGPGTGFTRAGDILTISGFEPGSRPMMLDLGEEAEHWAAVIVRASS